MSCPRCHRPEPGRPELTASGETCTPTICLVGNPNVGKSTLFNLVTGSHQAMVNAPGTTVEVMAGTWRKLGAQVLDLPGTYSLVAQSPDEQVVVETLERAPGSFTDPAVGCGVDLVVCILDATALTRSLYLLGQVALTGHPVVAAVTLADLADDEGEPVDIEALQQVLGIPVTTIDPRSAKGIVGFDEVVRQALCAKPHVCGIEPGPLGQEQSNRLFAWIEDIETQMGTAAPACVKLSRSDKIDQVLLNPLAGIPVFLGLMWLLLMISGSWVAPIQDFFEQLFASTDPGYFSLANGVSALLTATNLQNTWLHGFLVGGVCTGLGVVASFLPLMFVIFLLISLLEDSGYMARAAFLGDRLMRKIGLDGRVILPLIMGFGCNLPSMAAARAIPNAKQRLVTILVTPYTSCAARLTIYLVIARIFFPAHTGTVVFALYLLSILMVVLGALALKPFLTKGQSSAPLMLVLPAYHTPQALLTLKTTWQRSWAFVLGAGKIIVTMAVVVWLMAAIPVSAGHSFADPELPTQDSLYGATARALEPVFAPAGFGQWHMTGALMTGFVAKETVISSLVVSYNLDQEQAGDAEEAGTDMGDLPALVKQSFHESAGDAAPLAAFAFLVYVLTYTPCLATVAQQIRQIGARTTLLSVLVQLAVAWVLATGIYQIGRLFL